MLPYAAFALSPRRFRFSAVSRAADTRYTASYARARDALLPPLMPRLLLRRHAGQAIAAASFLRLPRYFALISAIAAMPVPPFSAGIAIWQRPGAFVLPPRLVHAFARLISRRRHCRGEPPVAADERCHYADIYATVISLRLSADMPPPSMPPPR